MESKQFDSVVVLMICAVMFGAGAGSVFVIAVTTGANGVAEFAGGFVAGAVGSFVVMVVVGIIGAFNLACLWKSIK